MELDKESIEIQIRELSERIYRLEDDIHDLQVFKSAKLNTPHKCPVCDGCAIVLKEAAKVDFDGMLRAGLEMKKKCNACEGKGIIWG